MTDYMKSRCLDCGSEITSNETAWEILYDKWGNELKKLENVALVCDKCFSKYYPTLKSHITK